MRLVTVEWTDAVSESGWNNMTRLSEYANWRSRSMCITSGHLLAEIDEGIVVGLSITDDGELAADSLFIPQAMVRSMTRAEMPPASERTP